MDFPESHEFFVAGRIEEVLGPASFGSLSQLYFDQLETHGSGVEAVNRLYVAGRDSEVVIRHVETFPGELHGRVARPTL